MKTRGIALVAVIASLYAIGVISLAPISFPLFQIRIADALIPLSIVFGMPTVFGLAIGTIVANSFSPFGYVDVIGGSIANLIAGYIGWKIGSKNFNGSNFIATIAQNLIVSSIVGPYIAILSGIPLEVGFVGVSLGSIVSMNILGYILILVIKKSGIQIIGQTKPVETK